MFGNTISLYQQTAISASTAETTIVTADANTRNQLCGLIITTNNAAAATLTLRDGTAGTTAGVFNYPNAAAAPGSPFVVAFDPPLNPLVKNSNWTLQASVNSSAFNVTAIYKKAE